MANTQDIAMQLNCQNMYGKQQITKQQNNKVPIKTCKIARKVYGNPKHNFCRLCLKEKLLINKFPNQNILLNKRSEFISKCRHENKLLIVNMK